MDKDVLAWGRAIDMIFKSFDKAGTGEIAIADLGSCLKVRI